MDSTKKTYRPGDGTRSMRDAAAHALLFLALRVGTERFAVYLTEIGDEWRARRGS